MQGTVALLILSSILICYHAATRTGQINNIGTLLGSILLWFLVGVRLAEVALSEIRKPQVVRPQKHEVSVVHPNKRDRSNKPNTGLLDIDGHTWPQKYKLEREGR